MKMIDPKKLELIQMGLLNTLFSDKFGLARNFGLFFPKSAEISCIGNFIHVTLEPGKKTGYDYTYKVEYCKSHNPRYPFKITKITQECVY